MILAMKLKVLGHPWTVYYLSSKDFKKRHGSACVGLTETGERRINLRTKRMKRETVVHELVHAYVTEMCLDVANLEASQMEEAMCDLMAKYGERIFAQADAIVARYAQLKEKTSS